VVAPYVKAKGLGMAMARVWAVKKEVMRSDDDGSIVLDVMCNVGRVWDGICNFKGVQEVQGM
jgi:hypothetical protein